MLNLFNSLNTLQKSLVVAIFSIVLFFASAGVSYSFFSNSKVFSTTNTPADLGPKDSLAEDPSAPRTEECPLNGRMHTKKAKDAWEKRRPLGVMIENHLEARPQSGLSSADVVYEAVAEGGITRFMAVFLCELPDIQVGPVRSARTYFLDWVSEYDGLYAHVGGAHCDKNTGSGCANGAKADALGQIVKYGIKSLNQFSVGFPTYWRDYQRLGHPVATEHTMYSTTYKLWEAGKERGWSEVNDDGERWDANFVSWKFKDDTPVSDSPTDKIAVNFWGGYSDYKVTWEYDSSCNCYKRNQGDNTPHLDMNTQKQIEVKNIVIQFQTESRANDGYEGNLHLLYGTIGKGRALIFQDGQVIQGEWIKNSRTSRSKYVDASGKEISFNRGLIWIQTVPLESDIDY